MNTEKTMHAPDLYTPVIDDQEGCKHLPYEFFYWWDDKYIIFQPKKENDKCGRNEVLKFRSTSERNRKKAGHYKSGKNAESA